MAASYFITDTGRIRELNQDFAYRSDAGVGTLPNLYVVADGMGGHQAGDLASRCAINSLVSFIRESGEKNPMRLLDSAFHHANTEVLKAASERKEYYGMGTTMVAAAFLKRELVVANVGDSRLYVWGEGRIRQITRDHSLVEEMVKAGTITRLHARTHPEKNVITRAIGAAESLRVDIFRLPIREGERILMCTDGLTNMLTDQEILSILETEGNMQARIQSLISAANRAGGKDNITALIAEPFSVCEEGGDRA